MYCFSLLRISEVETVSAPRALARSTSRSLGVPLTLQGSDYAHAVHELNKAIDRAEALLQ